ncbi:MAG: hypothetical protein KME46_29185, partial [Brasilonema angustatum HA4187-MV1]|nr:hypothetical protein [Brasilonema angustatum HA4187-MV1]
SDSIPNSGVKRCSGDDSRWVAVCDNSSMPGFDFNSLQKAVAKSSNCLLFVYLAFCQLSQSIF